jgi:hypothetical protein
MNKRNFIFLLSLLLINLIFRVNVITATRGFVPTNFDTNYSPKNILVGSYTGGRSHLKPMLDVAAILVERGHNVSIKNIQSPYSSFNLTIFILYT